MKNTNTPTSNENNADHHLVNGTSNHKSKDIMKKTMAYFNENRQNSLGLYLIVLLLLLGFSLLIHLLIVASYSLLTTTPIIAEPITTNQVLFIISIVSVAIGLFTAIYFLQSNEIKK